MTAGELLRTARRRHGVTQKQLAIRARTSQAAISRIERGLVSPGVDTLAELLRLMNEELVLDASPIDWGHDVTLIRANLALEPSERAHRGVEWSRRVASMRASMSEPEFDPAPILRILEQHAVD